jgi:hypothetical protein
VGRTITLLLAILITVGGTGIVLSETDRQKYDHFRAEAAAALSQGKIADAVTLATQAYSDMPNGSNITFTPAENGVAATIAYSGRPPLKMMLTLSQFNAWLDDYWSNYSGPPAQQRASQSLPPPRQQHTLPAWPGPRAAQQDATRETRKYRPPLTPQQIARPSNYHQQYLVALSAYDDDLVRIAQVRFSYNTQRLEWLEKAQQQRDANSINKTKPLIYPVR